MSSATLPELFELSGLVVVPFNHLDSLVHAVGDHVLRQTPVKLPRDTPRPNLVGRGSDSRLGGQSLICLPPVRWSMSTDDTEASGETTVSESYSATVPAAVRDLIDLQPGDKLRWRVEDGDLHVEIVHQREGVFDDLETISAGVDVVEDHDLAGAE